MKKLLLTFALLISPMIVPAQVRTFTTYTPIPWSTLTTYYLNDMVTVGTGTSLTTYISLLPVNVGNIPATTVGTAWNIVGSAGTGGGGGGLTSFTVGNLSPLFIAALGANPTTAPALTFTLSNAAQNSVLAGPATGGAGPPSYQTAPQFSAANLINFPTFNQSTTGNASTASAFFNTPALCTTSGQVPTGILANGNATGCFTPPGAAPAGSTGQVQTNGGSGAFAARGIAGSGTLIQSAPTTPVASGNLCVADGAGNCVDTGKPLTAIGTSGQIPQSNGTLYAPVSIGGDCSGPASNLSCASFAPSSRVTLSTANPGVATVTVTGTYTALPVCQATDQSKIAAVQCVPSLSGSTVTLNFYGTTSDVIQWAVLKVTQ